MSYESCMFRVIYEKHTLLYYALYARILILHGTFYGCLSPVFQVQALTTTLHASHPWRPRASLLHRRHRHPHIESDQSHAVLPVRVHMMFYLTIITTAINERHRRPHSTSDPDLILSFAQHRPFHLLYAQQIPAFLICSLRLLVPPFLPLLNLHRTSNHQTLHLVHTPCL